MNNEMVRFSVICVNPLPKPFGLQDKNRDIVEGELLPDGRLQFWLELKVKEVEDGPPNFTGPYAHGRPLERFLYLTQKTTEGTITRRVKLHLKTITWEQVQAVLDNPDAYLEAAVDSRMTGTVPLLGDGWTVETKSE